MRREFLCRFNLLLTEAQASGRKELATRIGTMIEHVESLRIGAFAPCSERPVFKGIPALAGSVSGIALIDCVNLLRF